MSFKEYLEEKKSMLDFIPGRKEKRVKKAIEKHGDMLVTRARGKNGSKSLNTLKRAFQWKYSTDKPDFEGYKKDIKPESKLNGAVLAGVTVANPAAGAAYFAGHAYGRLDQLKQAIKKNLGTPDAHLAKARKTYMRGK